MDTPTENAPASQPQLAPGLRWGIKRSFIDYVRRMADGKGTVGNGAVPVGTGDLFYEYDEAASLRDPAAPSQVWAFRGDVRFSGHFGMLFVRIAHPRLEISGTEAVLTIEDPQDREGAPRIPLVTARLQQLADEDGAAVWGAEDVTLTADGVPLFNEVYVEGEAFEPLIVQLPLS